MIRPFVLFAVASAIAPAPAQDKADNSWPGVVVTKGDQEFEGRLLFARGKLFVDTGEGDAEEVAIDQIRKLKFHDRLNAGKRPAGKQKWQNGLHGEYFNGTNFDRDRKTRIDRTIDFPWGHGSPMEGIGEEQFSARWTGEVRGPITGKVNFHARSDDGVRVWVGGKQILDGWGDHAETEYTGSIDMVQGTRYPIRVDYYENASDAVLKLLWSGPSLPRKTVPADHLFTSGVAGTFGGVSGDQKLWLRGGSRVRGTVLGLDEKFIEFAVEGGVIKLPVPAVAVVDLLGWWQKPDEIDGRPEGVLLREGGDFYATKIKGLDEEGKVETFSPLFGNKFHASNNVRALKYGDVDDKDGKLIIRTGSWSWIIRAEALISKGERLIVRDSSGQYLNLPLSVVFGIEEIPAEGPK